MKMKKIKKNTLPKNHSFSDFKCLGPVSTVDGEFIGTKIADLLCFSQEKVKKSQAADSNKEYHALICTSKINSNPYVYVEYGRVGDPKSQFQFIECSSESEAEQIYIKQCLSKNTKRAIKTKNSVLGEIWQAKPGKDFYKVQNLNSRSIRITDANNISNIAKVNIVSKKNDSLDEETQKLFADLGAGTSSYTRNSIVGNIIPSQVAIDETRLLLDAATKLTNKISQSEYNTNKELKEISTLVYSRIPKKKHRSSTDWILTPDQIYNWRSDLDAYESVLSSNTYDEVSIDLRSMNLLKFKFVPRNSERGGWIYDWVKNATGNKHTNLRNAKLKNVWYFRRVGDVEKLNNYQKLILNEVNTKERPSFQPKERFDKIDKDLYTKTNTAFIFHGTRSINCLSIIKESLRFPKELSRSQITGKMFGEMQYFASDWKKSLNYCSYNRAYWSGGNGGIKNRGALMFIADVVCANMFVPSGPRNFIEAPKGYHSIFAKPGKSGILNEEIVIPKKEQIMLRYLLEFE